ncbi:cobalt-precorrin-5B (C(1))-methyltransferase [Kushneria phosphatilytica]|uniref:Cobalt-precorrin-5B C(1)-methyltransferase n=1 Tax=Kushneria phosphatilytica TaxID=657387 RepID=A0A1S1NSK4_9GAMM|nr:cobalt-precorrin-5B (C(1))-methyltransferase [Kushneria phosphatilytica]OHV08458.1 cobalt-precorrin-5B (C(1))-methyltransferase [Kushneria phosphatilytica]QEL09888.1 cobalt-precorrin-5B (C(1))-methyltransferase [Kushneria phosphatilytica]
MNDTPPLKRGWTTGCCATAAARAAYGALLTGEFVDPVMVRLPRGQTPSFALAVHELYEQDGAPVAMAGVIKDAGDDPDATHGVLVRASIRALPGGSGLVFRAGPGVGTVTRPGLPIPVGEPAINPVPRRMILEALQEVARETDGHHQLDLEVTIGIDDGERIATETLNPRLGILGGLSVLGTTGVVIPFSCSAWIHSIHRGIDVARARGLTHIAGSTGSTSESAVQQLYALDESALIEMGDFVGGMLKYLRAHPVPRVTVAGGIAKMAKLGQGMLDVHSRRGGIDLAVLAELARLRGADDTLCDAIAHANSGLDAFEQATAHDIALGDAIAEAALATAARVIRQSGMALEVCVFDRRGECVGRSGWQTC